MRFELLQVREQRLVLVADLAADLLQPMELGQARLVLEVDLEARVVLDASFRLQLGELHVLVRGEDHLRNRESEGD